MRGVGSSSQAEAAFVGFDTVSQAPARHERIRERCIEKVDGECIINDPTQARRGHGPVGGAAIRIKPCGHGAELAAKPFRWHADTDARRKSAFGFGDHEP